MQHEQIKGILESALLASGSALSLNRLLSLFDEHDRPSVDDLQTLLDEIQQDYANRAIQLKKTANGYCFLIQAQYGPWVSRLWEEKPTRYTRATLETLAIIAYRQPVTRGEIEDIRGVAVASQIIKSLLEREWVRVVGHREVIGRPALYATTRQFLEHFSLQSLDELPPLAEIHNLEPNIEVEATNND